MKAEAIAKKYVEALERSPCVVGRVKRHLRREKIYAAWQEDMRKLAGLEPYPPAFHREDARERRSRMPEAHRLAEDAEREIEELVADAEFSLGPAHHMSDPRTRNRGLQLLQIIIDDQLTSNHRIPILSQNNIMSHYAKDNRMSQNHNQCLKYSLPDPGVASYNSQANKESPEMQYWKPNDTKYSVGDCMPFWHGGRYHLYYLIDEGHHNSPVVGGLGGHSWAHRSSKDLKEWIDHPLAVPVDFAHGEASICTGSPLDPGDGSVLAFYAMRPLPPCGEFIRMTRSVDGGTTFEKSQQLNLAPPEGFGPDFRDPVVFKGPDGLWHMLVATKDKALPDGLNGCLGSLNSKDLVNWKWEGVVLRTDSVPECPDIFEWDGLHYLLFGNAAGATSHAIAQSPLGPWTRPARDIVACPMTKVMKTAQFDNGRRIGAAWIPYRNPNGGTHWGGRAIFREIVRRKDGSLGVKAVPEMELDGPTVKATFKGLTDGASTRGSSIYFEAANSFEVASIEALPADFKLKAKLAHDGKAKSFGFAFKRGENFELRLAEGNVKLLHDNSINCAEELKTSPLDIEIVVRGEVIDARIGDSVALINSLPSRERGKLCLFCNCGKAKLEDIEIKVLPPLV